MNELNDVLGKRLRGMAVRILACIEHTVKADLDGIEDNERFTIMGGDLKVIRSEILNAAGDTTRSLGSLLEQPISGKRTISRETILALNSAKLEILEFEDESVPIFTASGDFGVLRKIRDDIRAGIVYNAMYKCAGIEDVVDNLIPFLDVAVLAGVRIANGDYKVWRDQVCKLYLEGLEQ
jgi:hypothetical protein